MKWLITAIDRLTGATGVLGAWMVAPLVIAICYEVFARYILGAPTIWAFELGYMLTGANFLLGAALVLRSDCHIRVDVLYGRYSERTKAIVNGLTYLVIVVPFCAWLSIALWHYAFEAYVSMEGSGQSAWNPPIWPYRVVYFISFAILGLQAFAQLLRCLDVIFGRSADADDHVISLQATGHPRGR